MKLNSGIKLGNTINTIYNQKQILASYYTRKPTLANFLGQNSNIVKSEATFNSSSYNQKSEAYFSFLISKPNFTSKF